MNRQRLTTLLTLAALAAMPLAGCEQLPGDPETQTTAIGAIGGAAAGAALYGDHPVLGAAIGGALGAAGGYLLGTRTDLFDWDKDEVDQQELVQARQAVQEAQADPATPDEVIRARTADLNDDGFVTMDEVIAMQRAGLSDSEMILRLEASGQTFSVSPSQRQFLLNRGVSDRVITAMAGMTD